MAKKKKFYVVWAGHKPGVYTSWDEANAQIAGFSGAKYKSFSSVADAEQAYKEPADMHYGKGPKKSKTCLLYTSPSPRDRQKSRMPSSA